MKSNTDTIEAELQDLKHEFKSMQQAIMTQHTSRLNQLEKTAVDHEKRLAVMERLTEKMAQLHEDMVPILSMLGRIAKNDDSRN